ncbi:MULTISPECIES: hypothetical protein [unclassified Pseudonocardia]|uniref:hypothetical protein n=1 Tax=unclassified Pseudonocardia TaxID=2619320 RepID=UPI000962D53E|nr:MULTISPECIES: hypothetical protein [unclassified Pseudonocardia]MBN9103137.1 hypothetical protein [Pseudonocardia sp.]OJY41607.1 MAG: hypothetical protein BGP03_20665 [Pseudonocardia sp. 73-21]
MGIVMPSNVEITVEHLADDLVVDSGDVRVVLRQHDVHADELLAHNVLDVRSVLDPGGERASHYMVISDGQFFVSLEEEQIALLRSAAQHVGQLTGIPSELSNTIARTLYAVVIELNNKRALPIEVRRAAVSMAEEVLTATESVPPSP